MPDVVHNSNISLDAADKPRHVLTIRNSTAEFLVFTQQAGESGIEVRYEDRTIWLTQKLMAELFDVTIPTINEHLKNIFKSQELDQNSVIRKFLITASDGKKYNSRLYNLDVIISVGYRINSKRADSNKQHMGLTTWENSPNGKILKTDVSIAKNYLSAGELDSLGRIVNAYLELAEGRAKRKMPMTMEDWAIQLDKLLDLDARDILKDAGKISTKIAKDHAESEFERYRVIQDRLFESDFDREIKAITDEIVNKGKGK